MRALVVPMRQFREAHDELVRANEDLRELLEFAGGLAARAHDLDALVAYAQDTLSRLTGAHVRIAVGLADAGGDLLVSGGESLGAVFVHPAEGNGLVRWERLREALLPQLATAVESASLVEKVRKTHLQTIAALSHAMEAKDYYTGGHTER